MKKTVQLISMLLVFFTLFSIYGCEDDKKPEDEKKYMQAFTDSEIFYDNSFWQKPETFTYEEITGVADPLSTDTIQALFYRGADFEGEQTRVFCYISFPDGASVTNKVPAVVLVHGGGGTAYKEWVKNWTDKGYAVLSYDYQGNMPLSNCTVDTQYYQEIPGFTAPKNISFNDSEKPIADQWMYYATSAAILGNSLLRSYPQVDNSKIGMAGISWGSIITTITIGYDDRFAFACPIYGGIFTSENNSYMKDNFVRNPKAMVWDDSRAYAASKMPILFTAWNRDTNFTMNVLTKNYLANENATLSILSDWWHSHSGGMFAKEPYVFADSVCKNEESFIQITKQPTADNDSMEYQLPQGVTVSKIQLLYTAAQTIDGSATWISKTITSLQGLNNQVSTNVTAYYVSIMDSRGVTVSSAMCVL